MQDIHFISVQEEYTPQGRWSAIRVTNIMSLGELMQIEN